MYVYDMIIDGNDLSMLMTFKKYLSKCFHMKELGKRKYFLGIEVARGPLGMFLTQMNYYLDILSEAGLLDCKPALTPVEKKHKLLRDDGPL